MTSTIELNEFLRHRVRRRITTHGYTVMRIPGARVFQNPMRCARDIAHRLEQMAA